MEISNMNISKLVFKCIKMDEHLTILVIDSEEYRHNYDSLLKPGEQFEFLDLSQYRLVVGENTFRVIHDLEGWPINKQITERLKSERAKFPKKRRTKAVPRGTIDEKGS